MSNWDETRHDRDTTGKFSEMPGSAPESALAAPPRPWGHLSKPTSAAVRQARYEAAISAYHDAGDAINILSAQAVAAGVREHYPDAVGVTFEESDQSLDVSYDVRAVTLGDGSSVELTEEQWDEVATAASDIRPRDRNGWFTVDGGAASMSIDEVLELEPPRAGRFVADDADTLAETGAKRTEHVMRSGWVDLPSDPSGDVETTRTAVADALTDLVHFTDRYDIDIEAVMEGARETARKETVAQH